MTAKGATAGWLEARAMAQALRGARPALLFALRLWVSVCIALYVAFWLQLSEPSWAGTTAAIVCQPQLGASLRKASFRLIGTIVGAIAIVILTALFPQDRIGFLFGLALWGAACGFVATLLHNFAAYGAALAGYTAALIASDELGATTGPDSQVILFAIYRALEIGIGIVSAGVVLALTDLGGARRQLAATLAALAAEASRRFADAFAGSAQDQRASTPVRRELYGRVIALDPVIDTAIGESSELRYRSRVLQAAVGGLFAVLSAWRTVAFHLVRLPPDEGAREGDPIRRTLPGEFLVAATGGGAPVWIADPSRVRRGCWAALRELARLPATTPSAQLLADAAAEALLGAMAALNGLAVLVDPGRARAGPRAIARLRVADWLPAMINGLRVFVTIGAVSLFWIVTAWPSGALAIAFAAIIAILLSPQIDQAYPAAIVFLLGACVSATLAAVAQFYALPQVVTFPGLCLVLGLFLVPLAMPIALPFKPLFFTAAAVNFVALLAPANEMSYDAQRFLNSALAIVAGIGAAALAMRLLPPPSPATRTRRLLALTLADLRRLAQGRGKATRDRWEGLLYARLVAMPAQPDATPRAQLAAALSVGTLIIRLRNLLRRFDLGAPLEAALGALAEGRSAAAVDALARLDGALAAAAPDAPGARARLRARAFILSMSEALTAFAPYFDAEAR